MQSRWCVLAFVVVVGCSEGEDEEVERYEQPPACEQYVTCAALVIPAQFGPILEAYGPEGSCWVQGEMVGVLCDDACQEGLEDLRLVDPDEPACEG